MGQQESIVYSQPWKDQPSQKKGQSQIYRRPQDQDGLKYVPASNIKTLQDMWANSVQKYGNNNCLSQREGPNKEYKPKTYKEVNEIVRQLGSGILNMKIAPEIHEYKDFKLKMVGIYAKNRSEWMLLDICSYIFGFTIIPLYDTLGPDSISYCLNHSGVSNMFCATEQLSKLLNDVDNYRNLQYLIALDPITPEQEAKAKAKNLKLFSFQQLLDEGKKSNIQPLQQKPETIMSFSYTSGTTGVPKAAMISHSNFVSLLVAVDQNVDLKMLPTDVYLSYLPLPHVFDRLMCISILYSGASLWFYGGDILKIKEDLIDVRPTIFVSVPRLYNKFYDVINQKFQAETGVKKWLIDTAVSTKTENLANSCDYTHKLWDLLVFKKIRDGLFGGRLRYLATGSAPISKEVINFFKIAACKPVFEGYGQTESMGASFITFGNDPVSGHVGGPQCNVEFKVVDIPDMNYFSTDKNDQGIVTPRGEVCIRGPGVFKGYYKDEEKTKETIDGEGWLHTGDVGVIQPNGSLRLIDRKKNIFKLAQGEYVAPEKIENCYLKVQGVAENFVYGDSLQAHLVGIVVPDKDFVMNLAKENNIQGTFEQLCQNQQINEIILKSMIATGKKDKLFGFEQVKTIHLEPVSLQMHGCFTSTMKLQRHIAKKVFENQIKKMYGNVPLQA